MELSLLFILIITGITIAAINRNLIKVIVGIIVAEYGIVMLLLDITKGKAGAEVIASVALFCGLSATVTLSALSLRIYDRYHTFDLSKIRKLKG
jgi:multisubunit Na+/H+ antiporter MnhC subunit